MSRDFITIAIVLLCIAALVFLIFKTVNLSSSNVNEPGEDSNYLYDDAADGGISGDTATADLGETDTDQDAGFEEPSVEYIGKDEIAPQDENTGAGDRIPTSFNDQGDYLVLAGSFRIKSNAESQAQKLRNLGYGDAEIALFNRGAYASVIVDRFVDLSSANDLVRELKSQHGVEAYVQAKRGSGN
jgi:hypothetical protein